METGANVARVLAFETRQQKTPQPKCQECIRNTTGRVIQRCARHERKFNGNGAISLSANQLRSFLHAAQEQGPREYALFLIMFLHATRVSELTALRLGDVNFNAGTIQIQALKGGKGGPEQFSAINGFDERDALLAYMKTRPQAADTAPLFISRKSKTKIQPLHRSYVLKMFVKLAKSVGLPDQFHHPHVLRHSLGQLLYDTMTANGAGANMPAIQFALRHQNANSTTVYAKPNANQVHEIKSTLLSQIL